ncbi:MAG: c-type cytochrome [Planctomycetota bacterium]|nr:c-type cytochrome [Planctomycetota bacterium]
MARDTRKAPDSVYNVLTLNRVFLFSSILLFASVNWMIFKDYAREWKHYQRVWFQIEEAKTRWDIEAAEGLIPEAELRAADAALAAAKDSVKARADDLAKLKEERDEMKGPIVEAEQNDAFAKAEWEAQRFTFELIQHKRGPDDAKTQAEKQVLEELRGRWNEARTAMDNLDAKAAAKDAEITLITSGEERAEKRRRDLLFDVERLKTKLASVSPTLTNRIRNLPVVEMANPSIKVDQIILDHLEDDYHFVQVGKADRCMTCHKGIDSEDYQVDPDTGKFIHPGLRQYMATKYTDEAERRKYTRVFMAHPDLDLYLSGTSPHPMDQYGCTVCHEGQGRSLGFVTANHHPSDPEEEEVWKDELDWHEVELWERRMLPTTHIHSSCLKCHQQEREIRGADDFNRGREIFRWAGCFGCHKTEGYEDYGKHGPDLTHIGAKLDEGWTYNWILDPRSFRPGTRMPSFFNQSNNSNDTPGEKVLTVTEVLAITRYLYSNSDPIDFASANHGITQDGADAENGEFLVHLKGCLACHSLGDYKPRADLPTAPDLGVTGSKVGFDWLVYWLKDPYRYNQHTRMPNLRLSDEEIRDVAVYLTTQRDPSREKKDLPSTDTKSLESLVLEHVRDKEIEVRALQIVAGMSSEDRLLYLGEKLIARYGCFGCHEIKGFENATPIGVELSGAQAIGSKETDRLDFGFIHGLQTVTRKGEEIHIEIEHNPGQPGGRRYQWLKLKLLEPRIWDWRKDKTRSEKLRMPNFYFSEERASSLVTYLLALTSHEVPLDNQRILTSREKALVEGRRLVKEKNCIGCHTINYDRLVIDGEVDGQTVKGLVEGEVTAERAGNLFFTVWRDSAETGWMGGDSKKIPEAAIARMEPRWGGEIRPILQDYYVEELGEYDESEVPGLLPPVLVGEGKKVQPGWLFGFLKNPVELRPWLDVKMPTFAMTDSEAAALVAYFSALEEEELPYEHIKEKETSYVRGITEKTFPDYLERTRRLLNSSEAQCTNCHIVAGKKPTEDPASLAPDLSFARERLRPHWIRRWLRNPASLQPGTKMPVPLWGEDFKKYLNLTDTQQIEAMKNLLYHLDNPAAFGK